MLQGELEKNKEGRQQTVVCNAMLTFLCLAPQGGPVALTTNSYQDALPKALLPPDAHNPCVEQCVGTSDVTALPKLRGVTKQTKALILAPAALNENITVNQTTEIGNLGNDSSMMESIGENSAQPPRICLCSQGHELLGGIGVLT